MCVGSRDGGDLRDDSIMRACGSDFGNIKTSIYFSVFY